MIEHSERGDSLGAEMIERPEPHLSPTLQNSSANVSPTSIALTDAREPIREMPHDVGGFGR